MKKHRLLLTMILATLVFVLASCLVKTYTVTFDSDGGSDVAAVTVDDGEKVAKPADPTKDGYVFAGWYLGDAEYDFDSAVEGDITLKAKWEQETPPAPETFTVTFDSDGGSDVAAVTVADGEKVAKPADPTKSGYTFLGWYLGDAEYDFDSAVEGDITLKAKWDEETVEADGTSFGGAFKLEVGVPAEAILTLAKPSIYYVITVTESGAYTLSSTAESEMVPDVNGTLYDADQVELASNEDINGLVYHFSITYELEAGKTYYLVVGTKFSAYDHGFQVSVSKSEAPSEDDEYTVTFDSDGGSNVADATVVSGEKVAEPEAPTKDGYTFLGWYLGDVEYDFDSAVEGDITLVARWSENTGDPVVNITLEDLIGKWVGTEEGFLGSYTVEMTVNADGTGSISYKEVGSDYSVSYVIDNVEITANKAKVQYLSSMTTTEEYFIEFTYDDGVLSAAAGGMYGEITLTKSTGEEPDDDPVVNIPLENLVGTWTGAETQWGESYNYTVVINADGKGTMTVTSSYSPSEYVINGININGNVVVINYSLVDSETSSSIQFTYDQGALVGKGMLGRDLTLTSGAAVDPDPDVPVEEGASFDNAIELEVGVPTDAILTEAKPDIYYVFVVTESGTYTFASSSDSLYSPDVNGVLYSSDKVELAKNEDSEGYHFSITYDLEAGKKYYFVVGTEWGDYDEDFQVTLTKEDTEEDPDVPVAGPTLEDLVGKWTGTETTSYGSYAYDFTINADGTGSGTYASSTTTYNCDITEIVIDGNKVTVKFATEDMFGGSPTIDEVEFTYDNGALTTSKGVMWGALTLTKGEAGEPDEPDVPVAGPTLEDLAGKWTGTEAGNYGNYNYDFTINADGTGSGSYSSSFGPTNFDVTSVVIDGNKVTITFDEGYFDSAVEFTYADGVLSSEDAINGGALTLTKGEAGEPDEPVEPDEPAAEGTSFDSAIELEMKEYTVSIVNGGDKVYFKVELTEATGIRIIAGDGSNDARIFVYDANKLQLVDYDKDYGEDYTHQFEAAGTYYIAISYFNAFTTGEFSASFSLVAGEEPNEPAAEGTSFDSAIELEMKEYTVSIVNGGDKVYFKVELTEATGIRIIAGDGSNDARIFVYDANKLQLVDYDKDYGEDYTHQFEAAGTYYIAISYFNAFTTGEFSASFSLVTGDEPVEPDVPEIVGGTSFDNAIALEVDVPADGILTSDNPKLYYVIVVTESGSYTLSSTAASDMVPDINGTLYDADQVELASNEDINGMNYHFSITYELEAGKTYYLAVGTEYSDYDDEFKVTVTKAV